MNPDSIASAHAVVDEALRRVDADETGATEYFVHIVKKGDGAIATLLDGKQIPEIVLPL